MSESMNDPSDPMASNPWVETAVRLIEGGITAPQGFAAGAVAGGLKSRPGALDVSLVYSTAGVAAAAGTFTTNRVKAAPVLLCQERVQNGRARAVVTNSGQANACTGEEGMACARATAAAAAAYLGCADDEVLVLSTGVIGVVPSAEKIAAAIKKIDVSPDGGALAAEAIMTTDTRPKTLAVECLIDGEVVRLGGMCKGSGMIRPNMATMLAVLTTDAAVDPTFLKQTLQHAVDRSFNMISVDGDTSTNDTVLLLANGAAGNQAITRDHPQASLFAEALQTLCIGLAKEIARDGEGATKLVEVIVSSARSEEDARAVGHAIIQSSLVKSAIFGNDPNWGRIICAAGYSGVDVDEKSMRLELQGVPLFADGRPLAFDRHAASEALKSSDVLISLDLGQGTAKALGWGCDLTYKYVEINAEYTT